jgi:serine protease AprX
MTQYQKFKAGLAKSFLLLTLLTMVSTTSYGKNDNGKSKLSNRQNHGSILSQELDSIANDATLNGDKTVDVIIQFRDLPGDNENKSVKAVGGVHKGQLHLINSNLYSVPVKSLKTLANNPNILYITPDRKAKQFSDYSVQTLGADLVQNNLGFDGSGIGVAVIDSGIYSHPDLKDKVGVNNRIVYSESFVSGSDASDQYGHGTHVAGIVAGNGRSSGGKLKGIAPGVSIVNLRVLDATGAGNDSGVIAAIQRAIALKSTYNIRIINLSLGRPVFESSVLDPLCQAVEQAWQAGIVVVAAAGNTGRDNSMHTMGYATIMSPGVDPYVITVGATNTNGTPNRSDDIMASFSSKGPTLIDHIAKPDVVAPGNMIASLMAPGSTLATNNPNLVVKASRVLGDVTMDDGTPGYFTLSGTSMATPMVSGTAALLLQKNPLMTPDQVKARLMKTATKFYRGHATAKDLRGNQFDLQYDIFTQGAGYLESYDALNSNELSVGSAVSPTVVRSPTGVVSLASNPNSVWNNSVIWGASVVWGGDAFLSGTSVVWGSSVVWGGGDLTADSVIWGASVVWGGGDMLALSAGDGDDDPTIDPTLTPLM